ncbi:MAG TPA: spore coat U domain-containing protein, partial [Burkholderiaceae bacterium]
GGGGSAGVGYSGTTATVSNSCNIALGQPPDMDFGSTASLTANHDSTTTISLSCPGSTSWKIGLNNGANALASQRRMKSPAGNYVSYELYRDSGRSQRWGNDTAGGTDTVNGSGAAQVNPTVITVYGRVPVQSLVAPGAYVDTVTVTLVY